MTDEPENNPEATRPPCLDDLLLICSSLNKEKASYIIIGGLATFQHGLARLTEDVDLLINPDPANVQNVIDALTCLPDQASREVALDDVKNYIVVRINDEITIDLMASACGVDYNSAEPLIYWREIRGVRIPFASPVLLWKTKQTHREKDALDRAFLRKWFEDRGMGIPE